MDLLGDLGTEDQLTSVRAENAVLQQKVKELSFRVKELTIENQSLLAEVELYRREKSMVGSGSKMAASSSSTSNTFGNSVQDFQSEEDDDDHQDAFVKSGNGVYPSDPAVTLHKLHDNSNPLCCSLNTEDTLLATGGADGYLSLTYWGPALAPLEGASQAVVESATRINCHAPVICAAFSHMNNTSMNTMHDDRHEHLVAAGCMDGSIHWIGYNHHARAATNNHHAAVTAQTLATDKTHTKYMKALQFCPTAAANILASASADGNVHITKLLVDNNKYSISTIQSLHFSQGAAESLCFSDDGKYLYVYVRNTPYLSCFNLEREFEQTKIHLNSSSGVNGGFEDHVSFAVLDMVTSPNNNSKYIGLATDTNRNIVLDASSGKHIRNLYGHTNDGYSQPKLAWSSNGQYIFGNTQEESSVCIWDVASSNIVKRLDDHSQPIRDLHSSRSSDTLVTTSFDKQTKIWLQPAV